MRRPILLAAMLFLGACAHFRHHHRHPTKDAIPAPSLEQISDNVWIHKSYKMVTPYGLVLSQGLIIRANNNAIVMVDTAWTDKDTTKILRLAQIATSGPVTEAVVTHAHADKMGGVAALDAAAVLSFANPLSNADAPARGLNPATRDIKFDANGEARLDGLVIFYPGGGHTRENIVVYDPRSKVLFGGCLIRPGDSDDLGYTGDADIPHWADAVRAVAAHFPEAEIVVPSHGPQGGRALLDHTIALAEARK